MEQIRAQCTSPPKTAALPALQTVQIRECGASALFYSLAQAWGLIELITAHVPPAPPRRRTSLSVGHSLVLAAINRAAWPKSKRAFAAWSQDTVLARLVPTSREELSRQRFWDHRDLFEPEHFAPLQRELWHKMHARFPLGEQFLVYDTTNDYTFLHTFNSRPSLPQRGRNTQRRGDLRQIALALVVDEARGLPGGSDPRIRWIVGTAETAPLDPPYGLITTGQSLHWMEHEIVMPRFRDAIAPGGRLVATDIEWEYAPAWRDKLVAIFKRYSPIDSKFFVADLFGDLAARGLFERSGFQRTSLVPVDLSIDEFVNALHSTSSLSRVTLRDRTDAFGDEVRALFPSLGLDRARFAVAGNVVWGRPL